MGYTTDPIPAWVREIRRPAVPRDDARLAHEAQLRRRRIEATRGENLRVLMRAPESTKA